MSPPYTGSQAEAGKPITISSDRIVAVIQDFIKEERKGNFSFLGRYSRYHKDLEKLLMVKPASPDDASLKQKAASLESANWFTFTEPTDHRTVAIRALDKENVKIENLVIGTDANRMCDAATWLRNTYCFDHVTPAKYATLEEEERNWWLATTGKPFDLLHLPLELREMIYLHAIGPVCVPDVVTMGGLKIFVLGVGQSFPGRSQAEKNRDPDIPCPNLSIFHVNQQVRMEAMRVANRVVVKRFTTLRSNLARGPRSSPSAIWSAASNLAQNSLHGTSFLRRIQLEMSAADYFGSIGIQPNNSEPGPFDLKYLFRFKGLKELDLRFISPKHKLACCPLAWLNSTRQLHLCQEVWIFDFFRRAWKLLHKLHVQKRVKISMSGCVKKSTCEYWSTKLNSSSMESPAILKDKKKGIIAAMETRGGDLVFRCECKKPCVAKTVEGEKSAFEDHDDESLRDIVGWQDSLDVEYWDFED